MMKYFDCAYSTPADNLACDEALLELCETGQETAVLRVWESTSPFVVLGYSMSLHGTVNVAACEAAGVPMLRRWTGGGTVVQGPGCVNFSLAVRHDNRRPFASLTDTAAHVLGCHQAVLQRRLGIPIEIHGLYDLAIASRKFSGNAQRQTGTAVLFHGTFLLKPDLTLIDALLPMPVRQPAYRANRAHRSFLTTLPLSSQALKDTLRQAWEAQECFAPPTPWSARVRELSRTRYRLASWTRRW